MPSVRIYPSLIASDILNLQDVVTQLDPHCAGYHIDIMDYHFVPNLTWGPMFANAIRTASHNQLWIDLLVEYPERYIPDLQLNTNDMITVHVESTHDDNIITTIKKAGYQAGIGINPSTPLEQLHPYIDSVDHVLLMSVEPGFSGQEFVPESIDRLHTLASWQAKMHHPFTIAMDGGIDKNNIAQLANIGTKQFSIGSGVFGSHDPVKEMYALMKLLHT